MVAFVASSLIAFAGIGAVIAYGRVRPIGAPMSWGQAIPAATFAFFLMFWCYGVVPHQWLQWANNELQWTPTKLWLGPGNIFQDYLPFELNYEKLRDIIVSIIYVVFIGAHVFMWVSWQNRARPKPAVAEITTSTYGRPLVRKR